MSHQCRDIRAATGCKIIQTNHAISFSEKHFAQVRPDKPRTSGYQKNTHDITVPKLARIGAGQASLTTSKRVKPAG